ncbi:hypothetical protein [Piscinibacter sp.]|jgi:hypothetical protein|uniref:hypothetical protein n=1 Tax=Piscinibacter sp. TaxID=1903157 RepID=UPI00355AB04D
MAKKAPPHPPPPEELHVVPGGRAALERQLLRSVLLGLKNYDELIRQLTPAANSPIHVATSSDPAEVPDDEPPK